MVNTIKLAVAVLTVTVMLAGAACGSPSSDGPQPSTRTGHPGALTSSGSAVRGDAARQARATVLEDLSWVSQDEGWALAGTPCGQDMCAELARTIDGGRTWRWLPAPKAYLPDDSQSVREPTVRYLRFVNPSIGYLFGGRYSNDVLVTRDGGRTWAGDPGPPFTEALEPTAGTVIRVAYDTGFLVQPMTGAGTWPTALMANPDTDQPLPQLVRPDSQVAYVAFYGNLAMGGDNERAAIYRSMDGGRSWTALGDPCGFTGGSQNDAYDLAAATGGFAAVLCTSRWPGENQGFALTSADNGTIWTRHTLPPGLSASTPAGDGNFAAPAAGRLVLAAGNRLAVSLDGGQSWRITAHAPSGPPGTPGITEFVGFESPATGRWVTYPRTIWTTRDGGLQWSQAQFTAG